MNRNEGEFLRLVLAANDAQGGVLTAREIQDIVEARAIPGIISRKLEGTLRGRRLAATLGRVTQAAARMRRSAFVAHSFDAAGRRLAREMTARLETRGLRVVTGLRPEAGSVAKKVLDRIDGTSVFVALLSSTGKGRPSPWLVSELGYAARRPRVVLLEAGIDKREIGGIQGDVEYLKFERTRIAMPFEKAARAASDAVRRR